MLFKSTEKSKKYALMDQPVYDAKAGNKQPFWWKELYN